MNEIQNFIITKLKTDATLVPSPFVNVVNRWPKPGGTNIRGSTPEFYEPDGRMKQAIWVEDQGEYDHPFAEGYGGRRARPNVIVVAYANDAGKTACGLVESRLLFHFGRKFWIVGGTNWDFRLADRMPYEEGEEYGYNGMIIQRFMLEVAGWQPLLLQ